MSKHDLLIIGAGLAGLRAAVEGVRQGLSVAVITKVHPVRSHSNAAQGGINAALTDRGDDWKDHAFSTIKGSDYLADQDAVEIMCKEAGDALIELEHMGVIFSRDDEGKLGTRAFGGQKKARTFFVGAITGSAMLHVLYEQSVKYNLSIYEEWFVTKLVKIDGKCVGVIAIDMKTGKVESISAKSVVIATGGAGRVFEPSTNAIICTGDGLSLALRAGAELMDTEMIQYHPTTLAGNGILLSEAARGEGAYLINSENERFMEKYAPDYMELASRDVVSRSEQIEIDEGRGIDGCVLLDMRHLGKNFIEERLGYLQEVATEFMGIDLSEKPIPIKPGMHYIMGGIKTDFNGATSVPGLYAAGECANVSVHGANRLGANSLLDTVVFGRRSAVNSVEWVKSNEFIEIPDEILISEKNRFQSLFDKPSSGIRPGKIRLEMAEAMTKGIGVWRDEKSINNAWEKVKDIRSDYDNIYLDDKGKIYNTDLIGALELDFMIDVAESICAGAKARKESRGAHFRTDLKERDDKNWLKHTLVEKNDDGFIVKTSDVKITDWEPEERVY
ncbi:MAG: fumarate reductase (quinol) flavoprotein subunit [Dehalococcoidia bacterium]|nr:fumarate reductase (quinol) flavoprotein subunit [Dehalococcoidia bacterium]